MALIIAGDRSGVGKTTVTLALLSFLSRSGYKVQSFKVGPDYIDPMFHTAVTGRPSRNLDPVLTSEEYVRECFSRHSQGVEYTLIEGVMGLFDGIVTPSIPSVHPGEILRDFASTAHIARLLDLPVLLVLDCSRLSGSIAAIAHGFRSFDAQVKIAGIILNRVGSDRHLELLQDALEPLCLPILGILRRHEAITIPDRHLGLVPSEEVQAVEEIFDRLAALAKNSFNWEQLLPLLKVETCPEKELSIPKAKSKKVKIGVARDRAFNFYYADNLELLEQLGAEIIDWSPLQDKTFPKGMQGLYFGGGFPEVFAQDLANNKSARNAVYQAVKSGMPTYAECGGLMYLCQEIIDFEDYSWPMVGILPTTARMGKRLTLGYRQATSLQNSPLVEIGKTIRGHEFHRSQLISEPQNPLFESRGYQRNSPIFKEGWMYQQVHASYLHLHWGATPEIPQRFLQSCHQFKTENLL